LDIITLGAGANRIHTPRILVREQI